MPEVETLKLKIGLSTETAVQDAKRLGKEVSNVLNQVDTSKLDTKMLTFIKNLTTVRDRTEQVVKELETLGNKKVPTQEYKELEDRLKKTRAEFDRLLERQDILTETGQTSGRAWETLNARMEQLGASIREDEAEMQKLVETGKAFTSGKDTGEYQQKLQQLNQLNQAENILLQKEQERQQQEQANAQANRQKQIQNAINNPLIEEETTKTKKATKAVKEHHKAVKANAQGHREWSSNLKRSLTNILKYAVGITTLVALFRKLRGIATEAFKVMAQEIPEVNTAISDMATAMKQVKANAGTMLQPLLQVLAPIITTITQKIAQLMNTIAQLFATLSGQNYIYEATVDYYDYAKSVEEASGALAGFDKLNVVGSGQKNSGQLTKDTVHYAKKYFDTMKIADSTLFKTIQKMKKLVDDIAGSFKKIWNNGTGERILGNLQRRLENILLFINYIVDAISRAWNTAGIGDGIAETLLGIVEDISGFIADITGDLAEWAKDLDLTPLMESLRGVLAKVKEFLQPILRLLRKIWKDYVLPMGKWIIEKLAPKLGDFASTVLDKITKVLEWLEPKLEWLMNNVVKPIAETLGQAVLDIITEIQEFLDGDFSDTLEDVFKFLDEDVMPLLEYLFGFLTILLQGAIKGVVKLVRTALDLFGNLFKDIKTVLEGIIEFITGVFSLDLEKALGGIKKIFMGAMNAIIDIIEGVVNGVIDAVNVFAGLIGQEFDNVHIRRWGETDAEYEEAVRKKKNTQLDYSPEIYAGAAAELGKPVEEVTQEEAADYSHKLMKDKLNKFKTGRKNLKISGLANGAVLPPNQPFLAMVGDQKSGTNVETPLSTIEQAVANVMSTMGIKVVFDVKGDPNGLFKAVQKKAEIYTLQHHGKSAF